MQRGAAGRGIAPKNTARRRGSPGIPTRFSRHRRASERLAGIVAGRGPHYPAGNREVELRRQLQLDGLRKQDPKTLEILIADALRLPLLQLSAGTLADLMALSEMTTLPAHLKRDLDGFAFRTGQQIPDLPDGSLNEEFIPGLEALAPELIPATLREHLVREISRDDRHPRIRERIEALCAALAETPPAAVALGTKAPRILRAEAGPPVVEPVHRKGARPAEDRRPRTAEGKKPAPSRLPRPRTNEDVEREQWLSKEILERLSNYTSSGLREEVLVAGLRHAAKATYPDMLAPEITKVLRTLADSGRVKHSAGRWARTDRIW